MNKHQKQKKHLQVIISEKEITQNNIHLQGYLHVLCVVLDTLKDICKLGICIKMLNAIFYLFWVLLYCKDIKP